MSRSIMISEREEIALYLELVAVLARPVVL